MIYIASPYTHPDPELMAARADAVTRYVAFLAKGEVWAYSPIAYFHDMAVRYNLPKAFDFWVEPNHQMIRMCKKVSVFRLKGWNTSKGVADEIAYAHYIGSSIRYINSETYENEDKPK